LEFPLVPADHRDQPEYFDEAIPAPAFAQADQMILIGCLLFPD
jgi:hypothetical protein